MNDEEDHCEEDNCEEISRQTFINIGIHCAAMYNEPHTIMISVLAELVYLHQCRETPSVNYTFGETCKNSVGTIPSVESELFSLASDNTDDTIFKYYISSSDEEPFFSDNSEFI